MRDTIGLWRGLAGALLVMCLTASAHAVQVDGVNLPDELTVEGQRLVLNGAGSRLYSFLKIKVYSAGLYVPVKTSDAQALLNAGYPRAVHLQMRVSSKKEDAIKAWDHYLTLNCKAPCMLTPERRAPFFNALASLKEGDEETYVFSSAGLELKRNGVRVAIVDDLELARTVLAGWIGSEPTTVELKSALLTK